MTLAQEISIALTYEFVLYFPLLASNCKGGYNSTHLAG